MTTSMDSLLAVMARLRDPDGGCPWDLEQSFATIAPYTIEEAYEVADAIERQNMADLKEELGDLLLQVVYHSRLAEEIGAFRFEDVAQAIASKMIARHPHVFADAQVNSARAQSEAWEQTKQAERQAKAQDKDESPSTLDDVPQALPALLRAQKLQKRAARVGFDWNDYAAVLVKIDEELGEIEQAIFDEEPIDRQREEVGDLLFTVVNLARHLGVDAEHALKDANMKFERRFRALEAMVSADGAEMGQVALSRLETYWQAIKSKAGA